MSRQNTNRVILEVAKEIIWLLICIVIAAGVMYPITSRMHYSQMWMNGALLVIAFTYFRYAIFVRSIYIIRNKWVKFLIILFNLNFFVFVLRQQQHFMGIYDSFTIGDMGQPLHEISLQEVNDLFSYFFTEITFCVVACLTMTAALTLRIVLTYWQGARHRLNAGNEE